MINGGRPDPSHGQTSINRLLATKSYGRHAAARGAWTTARVVAIASGAVLATVVPGLQHRVALAAVCVAAALAQLGIRRLGRARDPIAWIALGDVALTIGLTAIEPALWSGLGILLGAVVATTTFSQPRRQAVPIVVAANLGVLTMLGVGRLPNAAVSLAAVMSVSCLFVVCGSLLRGEVTAGEVDLVRTLSAAGAVVTYIDLATDAVDRVFGDIEAVTGYTPTQWSTLDRRSLVHPDDIAMLWLPADEAVPGLMYTRVGRIRRRDGRWIWIRSVRTVYDDEFGRRMLRGMFIDVTEVEESRQLLHQQATTDALTGLPNRVALHGDIERRLANRSPFALAIIDLDRFKEVNDTLGHEAGDAVLGIVAERLRSVMRPGDHLCRLGGDEFAIVFDATTGRAEVDVMVDRLASECSRPLTVRGVHLAVSMSSGLVCSDSGCDRATLMRHADIAMYQAKRDGETFRWFDVSLEQTSTMQLTLSASLPSALAQGQVRMHFQPQYDLITGELVGAEALTRWHHPAFGLLSPASFLELALLSESAEAFTLSTIDQTIEMIAHAVALGHPVPIAVNVAPQSLRDAEFAGRVITRLEHERVEPQLLTIEVTESDTLLPASASVETLTTLARSGVRIAIDDFGTGHSSLARLQTLGVDELKVDRAFVTRLVHDERDQHIVRSIVELAERLDCRVVAEGVDDPAAAALLVEMGCVYAQGFLFSRPVPRSDFRRMLEAATRDARFGATPERSASIA